MKFYRFYLFVDLGLFISSHRRIVHMHGVLGFISPSARDVFPLPTRNGIGCVQVAAVFAYLVVWYHLFSLLPSLTQK